ncbi:MAG: T9SS type A sorting domain-containing protein [Bacteroidetes bacterium]|nr:T9SS type A sorting domain-containing protein [Bacteroidota bacterium]
MWLLLIAAVMIPASLSAQTDTLVVTSDLTTSTEGNLNNAIGNIILSDSLNHTNNLSNTVFMLQPNGYYILTGTITTPPHSHLYLYGPTPGGTQGESLPQIAWSSSGGVSTTYSFDCYGDLTMKNVWVLSATSIGSQVGSSIVLEDDSLANLSGKGEHLDMDGCIIDYNNIGNGGGAIEPSCRHFRGNITNTYFRNLTDSHYRYYGRPVSWTYQSTTWHTDSLIFENCTIANVGYGYMQEAPEYADYVSFNHCTLFNTMMYTLESSYWWNLSVTNCVFANSYLFGDQPSADGTNMVPVGGMVNIDSAATAGFPVPFTDSSTAPVNLQRHILFANDSYGYEKWYINYLASNPVNDTAGAANKFNVMPAMSAKTYRFFGGIDSSTGKKLWPYINAVNLYPLDTATTTNNNTSYASYTGGADPGFILPPSNADSLKAFLMGRWATGANVSWAYDPTSDVQQIWPMNEDLSYSNSTLMTAAMGGLPLGDLYHWWGTLSATNYYTSWQAQSAAEREKIATWLNTGNITAVKERGGVIPAEYTLSQNYPNPFNPATQIEYSVPKNGFVTLKVYNILGQEVATLFSGIQHAGSYTATFDGSRLASGVYFYRLQAGNVSIAKKLVLMK